MASIALTLAEWRSVAHELSRDHGGAAPAGLRERIQVLLTEAPPGWPEQPYALDLDDASIEAVWSAHATITKCDPNDGQRADAVFEAMRIIRDHQR